MYLRIIIYLAAICVFGPSFALASTADELLERDEFRRTDAFAPTLGTVRGSFTSLVRLDNGSLRAMGSTAGRFVVTDFLASGQIIGSASDARIEASFFDPFRSVAGADALAPTALADREAGGGRRQTRQPLSGRLHRAQGGPWRQAGLHRLVCGDRWFGC